MSFALEVFAASVPADLTDRWVATLAEHGLTVEARPGLSLASWRGGWVLFGVLFADAGPRYPSHAVQAGFELDVGPNESGPDLAENAPEGIRTVLQSAEKVFGLSTSAGRTVADLRLQYCAAASLALVTTGVVYDPQADAFFPAGDAMQNAQREAEGYEASTTDDAEWRLEAFGGW